MTSPTLLFLGTQDDIPYTARLKQMVGTCTVYTFFNPISTYTEVLLYCKKRNITGVFSTSKILLSKLLNNKPNPSLDNYAGSYFNRDGIEFVFINPLDQLVGIPYAPLVTRRYISKLAAPETWYDTPKFNWDIVTASNEEAIYARYNKAFAIAVDIETFKEPLSIRCIGYTAIFIDSDNSNIQIHSCVLPITSMYEVSIMRKFNNLSPPKILQNGKYDISYLARYNAPLHNYLWDTINLFHCWYSEMPKDLAFILAFCMRESMYWKDLANTNDLHEYYKYNALDGHATAVAFIYMMLELPQYARNNYILEFPLVFPCHLSEMTGIKRDMVRLVESRNKVEIEIEKDNISLSKMVGTYPQIFNTNSAPQNKSLRTILGCKDIDSSDEKSLKRIANRHPLNARIANKILDIRGNRKLSSTYLCEGKELNGRILYSLNPHGTDTGRLASREHHFWCGLQIQNITQGQSVKSTFIADEGFRFGEIDLCQAESRGTAYVSGDEALLKAVTSTRDFHSINASAFFGIPYEDIYDDASKKVKNKPLRNLSKGVNHGANYLMGENVLIETMGEENVWEAKRLLNLPRGFGLIDTARYLLAQFHKTYQYLASRFYPSVVSQVTTTHLLIGPTGWTRYCFGSPKDNKRDKNAYVAHVPQSLNAMILNQAYLKVFYEIAINPIHSNNFKLCAQIHDSILCQVREGHEYLFDMVRARMEIPILVRDCNGKERTMIVPADIKAGNDGKGSVYWSDIE